jgi:hypothetical protein
MSKLKDARVDYGRTRQVAGAWLTVLLALVFGLGVASYIHDRPPQERIFLPQWQSEPSIDRSEWEDERPENPGSANLIVNTEDDPAPDATALCETKAHTVTRREPSVRLPAKMRLETPC